MRKHKTTLALTPEGAINIEAWLNELAEKFAVKDLELVRQGAVLAQLAGADHAASNGQSCLQQGLVMAEILAELAMDSESLAAALLSSCVRYAGLSLEDVREQFNERIAKLISGVMNMDALRQLHDHIAKQSSTIDNLRKMLLAMVDDVRVVFIKLAERLCVLRNMVMLSDEAKRYEAKEVMDIYALLANRLGIGHIKWELEDLSFRYLNPESYKSISKSLNSRRDEREQYVQQFIDELKEIVQSLGINNLEVTGRAKHIYSIYKKMTRKKVGIEEIYDALAFRVLVPTVEDCYTVLAEVHSLWKPIAKEFDDYIAQPKSNGYRSIHTAVIGPEDKQFEIQIRTFQMHEESELGVAAHWLYKEGSKSKSNYDAKIAWLRQVMDWQREVTETSQQSEEIYSQIFNDHIYVFTPNNDIVELPQGATPLDFAYHIHSEIGHRCRGAKINGQIVPLTYQLTMGDKVEILTTKQGHPSRDWLNPHLGYLATARARAKVHNWFRKQDFDKNLEIGEEILEKELKRLAIKNINLEQLARELNYKCYDDLAAGLGRGDVHLSNVIHAIQQSHPPSNAAIESSNEIIISAKAKTAPKSTEITVEGVGNLLTHMAFCCKPIPGDSIIGYITIGQGVSIHRQDCPNILHNSLAHKERLIAVNWGEKTQEKYPVDLIVHAYDRPGLVRDITNVLANENISITGLNCVTNRKDNTAHVTFTIEIHNLNPLSKILAHLHQLPNVTEVKRLG